METNGKQKPGIQIEIPAQLDAIYSNFAMINHTPSEVIIDFAQILPGVPRAKVQARVLLTPVNAKALHHALGENLAHYEQQFGPINMPSPPHDAQNMGGIIWRVAPEDA